MKKPSKAEKILNTILSEATTFHVEAEPCPKVEILKESFRKTKIQSPKVNKPTAKTIIKSLKNMVKDSGGSTLISKPKRAEIHVGFKKYRALGHIKPLP